MGDTYGDTYGEHRADWILTKVSPHTTTLTQSQCFDLSFFYRKSLYSSVQFKRYFPQIFLVICSLQWSTKKSAPSRAGRSARKKQFCWIWHCKWGGRGVRGVAGGWIWHYQNQIHLSTHRKKDFIQTAFRVLDNSSSISFDFLDYRNPLLLLLHPKTSSLLISLSPLYWFPFLIFWAFSCRNFLSEG